MKIYCAGQMTGKTFTEINYYFSNVKRELELLKYEVLIPLVGTGHAATKRAEWMVKTADLIFVNLTDTKRVSIGSVSELAWAHTYKKHSVLAMEENNIHTHPFILEMADIRVFTYEEAINYLKYLMHN